MQRALVCVTAGVLLSCGLAWSLGQNPAPVGVAVPAKDKETPTLRTAGTASVRLKPDAARVFFGVQTQAGSIKDARTENNRRVHRIMEALAALKIPELKTKTSDVNVDVVYGRTDGNQLPPIVGYRVSNTFTVLVQEDDVAKLATLAGQVLDSALENGASSVQQIAFLSRAGLPEARRQALEQAVADALANARALAKGAGKQQIAAVTIDGQPVYQERQPGGRNPMLQSVAVAAPSSGPGDAALVVGDLEVACLVNVTCTF